MRNKNIPLPILKMSYFLARFGPWVCCSSGGCSESWIAFKVVNCAMLKAFKIMGSPAKHPKDSAFVQKAFLSCSRRLLHIQQGAQFGCCHLAKDEAAIGLLSHRRYLYPRLWGPWEPSWTFCSHGQYSPERKNGSRDCPLDTPNPPRTFRSVHLEAGVRGSWHDCFRRAPWLLVDSSQETL